MSMKKALAFFFLLLVGSFVHSQCGDGYCQLDENYSVCSTDCSLNLTKTCIDGTAYSTCSLNKPLFCSNGELLEAADKCGCPANFNVTSFSCSYNNPPRALVITAQQDYLTLPKLPVINLPIDPLFYVLVAMLLLFAVYLVAANRDFSTRKP